MEYPVHILPGENKKLINCDISDFFICRYFTPIEGLEITNSTGYLNTKYIASPRERLVDLSTNLLGVFTIDDSRIKIIGDDKNYFSCYCSPNENVKIPTYETDFIIDESRVNWFTKIGDIINQPVKYENLTANNFEAKCRVVHTPARWNYWHYSIRWYITLEGENEGFWLNDLNTKQQKKYARKLATEALSLFSKHSTITTPDNPKIIDEEDYKQEI